MYEDILLPFDNSEGAAEALHHTSEIAHRLDATIHILFVADTTRDSVTVVGDEVVDALVKKGDDIVKEAAKTLDTLGVSYDTDVVQGNPAPQIVEYAEHYGYDLIVMPTHGREGLSRYLLGSTSEKVVRLSSVPVLSVRMQPDEQVTFPYKNILILTDGSPAVTRAANHGLSLAATLDSTVHILSVVNDVPHGLGLLSTSSDQTGEQAASKAVDNLASEAETYGITNIVHHVEHGTPINVILEYIESHDIDTVVMGTTGKRGTERILLGSLAEKVVRSVPVPVITVKSTD
ncbi:universal stress protein [Natronorubrum aibiense]|uniref:Universal stress protein n=1 Tax=Natronorubrum aibiense TaxID=348826 RepID=A0A5P9P8F0_9EURY|nr:universal stress protein [Natronorubrum aibiense]QFU84386.1 universal stress protein [Natronorubrum aibiense]